MNKQYLLSIALLVCLSMNITNGYAASNLCVDANHQLQTNKQTFSLSGKNIIKKDDLYVSQIDETYTLIDVRASAIDREKVKIVNALELPLHSIKSKAYLKKQKLLLIGDSFDGNSVEREVANLLSQDFITVNILKHGISSILTTKYVSVIDVSYQDEMKILSTDQVLMMLANGETMHIIHLGEAASELEQLNVVSEVIKFQDNYEFYKQLIGRFNQVVFEYPHTKVLLLHDDEQTYKTMLRSAYLPKTLSSLFMVSGGHKGMTELFAKMEIWTNNKGIKPCQA